MVQIKPVILFFALFVTTINYGQFTDVINSNRPGESMAAFSVGKRVFQAELGGIATREKDPLLNYESNGISSDLSLRYGAIFEQLEFVFDIQYQKNWYISDTENRTNNGLKQTTIGVKYLFYDPNKNYEAKPNVYSWKANNRFKFRDLIPAVGIYAGLNFDVSPASFYTFKEARNSAKIILTTQNQFGKSVLVTNLILDKVSAYYPAYSYIVTFTRGFSPNWSGFLENQGNKRDYYYDFIFRGGAAYLIQENIQIDAHIGTNYNDNPSLYFGGVGLSWRFDQNYNNVILRAPKAKKEKNKKNKSKKR